MSFLHPPAILEVGGDIILLAFFGTGIYFLFNAKERKFFAQEMSVFALWLLSTGILAGFLGVVIFVGNLIMRKTTDAVFLWFYEVTYPLHAGDLTLLITTNVVSVVIIGLVFAILWKMSSLPRSKRSHKTRTRTTLPEPSVFDLPE